MNVNGKFICELVLAPGQRSPTQPKAAHCLHPQKSATVMKKYRARLLSITIAIMGSATALVGQRAQPVKPADFAKTDSAKVVERGPHHRKWEYVSSSLGSDGQTVWKTNRYTEIGTGLHYRRDGQWVETSENIDLVPGGAMASQGPHQVGFAANLNTLGGINVLGPDGQRFRSHVLCLAYTDARTGRSVIIAEVQDSIGMLIGHDQILYPDAFNDANGVRADVRYVYRASGLEQDVIVKSLPPPETFGLKPEDVRLEVFTEFIEAPEPAIKEVVLSRTRPEERAGLALPDFVNQSLNFGAMHMDVGQAFPMSGESERDPDAGTPTAKTWTVLEGRRILIEAVQYPDVQVHLDKLEKPAGRKEARALPKTGAGRSVPPPPQQARGPQTVQRMAALPRPKNGFVIDYNFVTSGITNFTFAADTTYYVKGGAPTFLYGTTIIEGGAVIKITNNAATQLRLVNAVDCRTSPYRPAIFTSMHDNTVGDTIAGSTGAPTNYCGYMIWLGNSAGGYFNLHDLRVSYAQRAIYGTAKVQADLSNCQVTHSWLGFKNNASLWNLRNILVHDVQYAFDGATPLTNTAEHVTFHSVSNLLISGLPAINLTNCLLIGVSNNVSYVGTGVETNLNDAGLFQTVGAGAHYLAANSPYRDAGTTNINPALAADLKKRTTYPPIVINPPGVYYGETRTLAPQAQRDTDALDLGYHYAPLDYALGVIYLTNATFTVAPGTAVAFFNSSNANYYGLSLANGASLIAQGRAEAKINFVQYSTVQEMANTNWAGSMAAMLYLWSYPTGSPELRCRFTDFSSLGGAMPLFNATDGALPMHLTDCEFHGGPLYSSYGTPLYFTNCLFNRNSQEMYAVLANSNQTRNCTYRGGNLIMVAEEPKSWTMTDTLFVGTQIDFANPTNTAIAYTTNCVGRLDATNTNDVILTSLTFQTGPLGSFYVPTNTALYNAGSRNETNAGLTHYTMFTNNAVETNTTVDIGFHYVATDASGIPLDYDGDGMPNYWEDTNGNGSREGIETDWKLADTDGDGVGDGLEVLQGRNPLGGTLADTNNILNLRVFTPLK